MKEKANLIINKLENKKASKSKTVFLFIGILVVFIILSILSSNWFNSQAIKSIKINGNIIVSNGEIYDIINDETIDFAIDDIDLYGIKKKIEMHPYISIAKVWINSKGVLSVEIKENIPIAIIIDSDNNLKFVDDKANVMPYRFYKGFTNLPIINNVFIKGIVNKPAVKGAILILTELMTNYKNLSNSISEIRYSEHRKMYELLLTDIDCPIFFGRADNISDKLANLYVFWKNKLVVASSDISELRYIDVRWKDVVIVRNKNI